MPHAKPALSFRIFQNGQLLREDRLVQGVIKIGKAPSAHLWIDDESVSRMHAIVEVTGDEVSLIDLGSVRGTFVNGKKINKARLQTGDVLMLGNVRVELAISHGAELTGRAPAPPSTAAGAHAAVSTPRPAPALASTTAAPAPSAAGAHAAVSAPRPTPALASTAAAPAPGVAGAHAPPQTVRRAITSTAVTEAAGELAIGDANPPPAPQLATMGPPPPPTRAAARALPLDTDPDPAAFQRAVAESAEEPGGARAVEVAAMLGDSVIGVKHCMDPRSGKVTLATWGLAAVAAACLLASVIAFATSVRNAADNAQRRDSWVRFEHRPERASRPELLGIGVDWMAFGGLALGLVGLTLAFVRMRGERTSPYYRIGTAPGVELALENAPLPAFPLVAPSGDDFVFNYGAGIDGELIVDGKATPLAALVAAGRARPSASTAGAIEVPIPPKARIRARAGLTTFVVSAVPRPRRYATPLFAGLENRAMAYFAGSLAIHLAAWGFLQLIPPDAATVSVLPDGLEGLGIRATVTAQSDPPPERLDDRGEGSGKEALPSMALPSGAVGNPEAPKLDGRLRVVRSDDPPRLSRDEAIQIAIREGILGSEQLLSGVKALSATSDLPSGFDTENVNGPIYGVDGAGRGSFGGGVTGLDIGGGCLDANCSGTYASAGRYATINGGPHGGGDYKLPLGGGPHGRGHESTLPHIGDPVTSGPGYDKSIIRRYIRRHINEIGYCYEKQLLAHPGLGGEVMASFLISPTGVVQSSAARGFDAEVASCIAAVIKTIDFPAPGEGGSVQVNYPFRFHGPAQ